MKKIISILMFVILISLTTTNILANTVTVKINNETYNIPDPDEVADYYEKATKEEEKKIEEANKALNSILSNIKVEDTEDGIIEEDIEQTKKTNNNKNNNKKENSTSSKKETTSKVEENKNTTNTGKEEINNNIVVSNNTVLEKSNVVNNINNTLQNDVNQILETGIENNDNIVLKYNNLLIFLICGIVVVIIILIMVACKKAKNKANKE